MKRSNSKLHDVANLAGVSPMTVSRFFNEPGKVRPNTRERIANVVREIGYVPNGAARALASNRSRIIGAILPTLNLSFFTRELKNTENRLSTAGYSLIVASGDFEPEQEYEMIQTMLSRNVDGLLLVGIMRDPSVYQLLKRRGIPYVTTWMIDDTVQHPQVGPDLGSAAGEMASHLLDLGHTNFGVIEFLSEQNDRAQTRINGFRSAIETRGGHLPQNQIVERPIDFDEGRIAFRYLMGLSPHPTAVLCGSDVFALGALLAAPKLGIRVPQDVSVAGFDNHPLSSMVEPALTTIDLPIKETGQRAAEYLLDTINNRVTPKKVVVSYNVILRKSTGTIKQK